MDYGFLDGLFDFFTEMRNWLTFFSQAIGLLPTIFFTAISIAIISYIIFGGLHLLLKLIG